MNLIEFARSFHNTASNEDATITEEEYTAINKLSEFDIVVLLKQMQRLTKNPVSVKTVYAVSYFHFALGADWRVSSLWQNEKDANAEVERLQVLETDEYKWQVFAWSVH